MHLLQTALATAGIFLALSPSSNALVGKQRTDSPTARNVQPERRDTTSNPITLGTAATYTVFASSGISTVSGSVDDRQIITGDIGVGPIAITAITGFGEVVDGPSNTPFVTGNTYGPDTTNTQTVNVAKDVLTAFNAAYGLSASDVNSNLASEFLDTVSTSQPEGVLKAGVYRWAGTIVIGADTVLTLNGACGDLFVFQAAGAISTGARSQILLTGGLTAATVYWVSATAVTTGVGSSFAGMILAGTNVVVAGTLSGGVYSQTEVALHQASIALPGSTCQPKYFNIMFDDHGQYGGSKLYIAKAWSDGRIGALTGTPDQSAALGILPPTSLAPGSIVNLVATFSMSNDDRVAIGIFGSPYYNWYKEMRSYNPMTQCTTSLVRDNFQSKGAFVSRLDGSTHCETEIWVVGDPDPTTGYFPLSFSIVGQNGKAGTCRGTDYVLYETQLALTCGVKVSYTPMYLVPAPPGQQ